jgi:hypothetical protein
VPVSQQRTFQFGGSGSFTTTTRSPLYAIADPCRAIAGSIRTAAAALDQMIVATALPTLAGDLHGAVALSK